MTCKNTNAWKSWRSGSSRRNAATLWCRAKNPADLLKTIRRLGLSRLLKAKFFRVLRNKRLSQTTLHSMVIGDTNVEHEIHTSVCDPDSEQFFRLCYRLPFRRISNKRAVYSRHTGCEWRYDHAPCRVFSMDDWRRTHQRHNITGGGSWSDYYQRRSAE